MSLRYGERPAVGEPAGLLILHHGRGSDEHDMLGLADLLDPQRRLHAIAPRGPLTLPGWPGYHWYTVPRVGHPDPETFHSACRQLAALHDEIWKRTAITPARTVLGGFSMGAVMSYALALAGQRPVPAALLALSGFIPTVEGWRPDLGSRSELEVLIAHGRRDPVIGVRFARDARELLHAAGLAVTYLESDAAHNIDSAHIPEVRGWLAAAPGGRLAPCPQPPAGPHEGGPVAE